MLSELISVEEILIRIDPCVCCRHQQYYVLESVCEYHYIKKTWNFNPDVFIRFTEEPNTKSYDYSKGNMTETLPFTAGGTMVFVRINRSDNSLYTIEQLFGESMSINNYRRYIQSFNQRLTQIVGDRVMPVFPIKKRRVNSGYFRYWVFKERMTALYYPHDSMPRYDCEIEEYYRSDNCGINLLLDRDKIIAVDGWMNVPDELKHMSDMRLLISEKE